MASTVLLLLLLLLLLPMVTAHTAHPPSTAPPIPTESTRHFLPRYLEEQAQQMPILAPILSNLGFQELAMAVTSFSSQFVTSRYGPVTIFAPTDDSIRSCLSCSPKLLLREHVIRGVFPKTYLSKLAFGTKLETTNPGRCLTITAKPAVNSKNNSDSILKIFVDGVEVARPDLFNDGKIVIHGLKGLVTPLSAHSCHQDSHPDSISPPHFGDGSDTAMVRLMLRDVIVRLRYNGYSILALAMRVKYPELATLNNMTIFALNDEQIFAGGHSYITSMRYHVIPNQLLMHGDLLKLPAGSTLSTLVHGQELVITQTSSGDPVGIGFRINYVPIRKADAMYNVKIAIHNVFLPLPHLQPTGFALGMGTLVDNGIFGPPSRRDVKGVCSNPKYDGSTSMTPVVSPVDPENDGF